MKFTIGDTSSLSKTITDADIRLFADVTGDHNPVHLDDDSAGRYRFGRRIADGMLTASLISSVIANKLPGEGAFTCVRRLIRCAGIPRRHCNRGDYSYRYSCRQTNHETRNCLLESASGNSS